MIAAEQNRRVIKLMECPSHWSSRRQSDCEHANRYGRVAEFCGHITKLRIAKYREFY